MKTRLQDSYIYSKYSLINYVDLSEFEKKKVLDWRNNESIRVWSYNREPISWADHKFFLQKLKDRQDIGYWLIRDNAGQYIGVFNISRYGLVQKTAYLGTDAAPDLIGCGFGRKIMACIEHIGFEILQLSKLKLEVLSVNVNAIRLYEKCGYKTTGMMKNGMVKEGVMINIIIMEKSRNCVSI